MPPPKTAQHQEVESFGLGTHAWVVGLGELFAAVLTRAVLPRIESFVGGQPHIEVSPRNRPSEHSGENHPDLADDLTKIQSSRIRVPEPLARMERLADTCLIS